MRSSTTDGGFDDKLVGYRFTAPLNPEAQAEAAQTLEDAHRLGDKLEIAAQAERLKLCKRSPHESGDNYLGMLVTELRPFPIAAIELAVSDWIGSETFTPSFHELKAIIEMRLKPSLMLLEALRNPQYPDRHAYAKSLGYASEEERIAAIWAEQARRGGVR